MFRVSVFIIAVCILLSCNASRKSPAEPLTVKEFTKVYRDSLSKRFPKVVFKITNDSTISAKYNEHDLEIFVDNAYLQYKAAPDSIQGVFNQYLTGMGDNLTRDKKIDINKIIPVIKPIGYLDNLNEAIKRTEKKQPPKYVYERYNDELIIIYAQDTKSNIVYLTQDGIDTLSIPKDSLKPVAIRNLNKLLTNIESKDGKGIYMITAGGDYEASIILLDNILTKKNLQVDGDMVIAIPNRDMLFVTGSNDKENIAKVKKIAKESYETGSYPLSEYLYKWNGTRFEKYE